MYERVARTISRTRASWAGSPGTSSSSPCSSDGSILPRLLPWLEKLRLARENEATLPRLQVEHALFEPHWQR